jgi:hypothetical protein
MAMEIALIQMELNPDCIFCSNELGDREPKIARNGQDRERNL